MGDHGLREYVGGPYSDSSLSRRVCLCGILGNWCYRPSPCSINSQCWVETIKQHPWTQGPSLVRRKGKISPHSNDKIKKAPWVRQPRQSQVIAPVGACQGAVG